MQELDNLVELPHSISYVFRKRMQIDSLNKLPDDKRPPDTIIWWRPPEELTNWIDSTMKNTSGGLVISESEVE